MTTYHGDCLEVLPTLDECSVDAIVTDPPYGLEFMGKEWDAPWARGVGLGGNTAGFNEIEMADGAKRLPRPSYGGSPNPTCRNCGGLKRCSDTNKSRKPCRCERPTFDNVALPRMRAFQAWCEQWATECLRVLKPGGHLLAFGGSRTFHRLTCAIEDAGFEIRDSILYWGYGSGFPKGRRVNSDPRFCQCGARTDAGGRSDVDTAPAQDGGDHTNTADPSASHGVGAHVPSAHRATPRPQGSPDGCQNGHGCDGAPPHRGVDGGQSTPPPLPDAQGRNRSLSLDDDHGVRGRTRSRSGYSDRPSTMGSAHGSVPAASHPGIDASRTPSRLGTGSGTGLPGPSSDGIRESPLSSAFPQCSTCGKPNADGWNVALKPAYEPIVLARKPLVGTVAGNVLAHGTGGLNIDACRVAAGQDYRDKCASVVGLDSNVDGAAYGEWARPRTDSASDLGRWPANVILDEEAAALLDAQSGTLSSGGGNKRQINQDGGYGKGFRGVDDVREPNVGGASRFFYTAKASRADRGEGNHHPTVKPVSLMRWLVRLVTPPGGLVLDLFAGSGTTGIACRIEGFDCLLIEREAEYVAIIERRMAQPVQPVMDFGESA